MAFSEARAVGLCIAIGYDEVPTFEIGSIIIACEAQEAHIQVVPSHVRRMKRFWHVQHVDFCSANSTLSAPKPFDTNLFDTK